MKGVQVNLETKVFPGDTDPVLKDININIESGEFISLVGPSGAGKTTLLNIIAGLDRRFSGEILVGGIDIGSAKTAVGYVFQSPRLLPWLTIRDNLRLVLSGEPDDEERIDHVLRSVGLDPTRDAFPGALSGGMQRRVALARAFVIQPTLLLLDEPFVSVDAPTAKRLRDLLSKLCEEAKPTVIFVSHVLKEAIALADRVIFLSTGPATVVHETSLDRPRPRQIDDAQVIALHDRLLSDYPDLLSGRMHASESISNAGSPGV